AASRPSATADWESLCGPDIRGPNTSICRIISLEAFRRRPYAPAVHGDPDCPLARTITSPREVLALWATGALHHGWRGLWPLWGRPGAVLTRMRMMSTNAGLYNQDFYAWTQTTANLIRAGKWSDLDREALAEEIESLGKSDWRELASRIAVL